MHGFDLGLAVLPCQALAAFLIWPTLASNGLMSAVCGLVAVGIRDAYAGKLAGNFKQWERRTILFWFGHHGLDAVLGPAEPTLNPDPHEVGMVIEGVAPRRSSLRFPRRVPSGRLRDTDI